MSTNCDRFFFITKFLVEMLDELEIFYPQIDPNFYRDFSFADIEIMI